MGNNVEEKDEKIYELSENDYNGLIKAVQMYKEKYEEIEKLLKDEKNNVVELLYKIEALENRVKELESNI